MDNNCDVHFFNSGCIVHDQMSGQLIMKGPKHGYCSHGSSHAIIIVFFLICLCQLFVASISLYIYIYIYIYIYSKSSS